MSRYEDYVERFAKDRGITKEQAEKHFLVRLAKLACEDMEGNKDE